MKIFLTLSFCSVAILMFAQEKALDTTKELENLFESIQKYERSGSIMDSLYRGKHVNGPFRKLDETFYQQQLEKYQSFKNQLEILPPEELDRQGQISRQIMLLRLTDQMSRIKFKMYRIPMNAEGGFYNRIGMILKRLPFEDIQDYEDYIGWLPQYVKRLEDLKALMKEGIQSGIVAPKVVINNNMQLLQPWNVDQAEKSPFYSPFENMPEGISEATKVRLQKQGKAVIEEHVLPFYADFADFLQNEYFLASPDKPGIRFLPQGKAYYENRIRFYTTLEMTPDSVHQLGLQEVARIRSKMEAIIEEVNFQGTFEEFFHFLRTDQQFYADTPQELLNYAAWLSKKAEGELPKLFRELYSLPFTVAPVPDDIAPTYTGGRYVPGSWPEQRPGTYWVNTYKLDSRTLYTLPALTLHEAVPGHHLQNAIASELKGLPSFRNNYYISAFGEGWGLYSEYLGEEMGMYETPYDLFGRYTYEMWRACRLVVDTGIHYKGWTREEAVDYLQSNTALSLHEVNTEIDRYIGWPGQAVSYKIGELKIKALRQKAKAALGEQFDVRDFHFHVLKNGSVPLSVLEEEIEAYIKMK
ncbi:MAG: DUF885 domain-containing protein [Fulvivirga sp.]|nr:DUF885 domain-containing protein [Fulvivirga sp.]